MNNASSIFSLFKNLNLTKVLGGANKTLNFVKQAVPIYKEMKPITSNAKKFISAYKEIKKPDIKDITKIVPNRPMIKKTPVRNLTINDNLTFFQ